jgi:hypothetical protein
MLFDRTMAVIAGRLRLRALATPGDTEDSISLSNDDARAHLDHFLFLGKSSAQFLGKSKPAGGR